MSLALCRSFLSCACDTPTGRAPCVLVHSDPLRTDLSQCASVSGVVVDRPPRKSCAGPVKVSLFDVSVGEAFADWVVSEARRAGVGVVASQRLIDERLQNRLLEEGIVPIERISGRLIDAVRQATGARVMSDLTRPTTDETLGWASAVDDSVVAGCTTILGSGGVVTLILPSGGVCAGGEVERAAKSALTVLFNLLGNDPRLVPGGGAVECSVSRALRSASRSPEVSSKKLAEVMLSVADCFDDVVSSLDPTADRSEMLESLNSATYDDPSGRQFGWDHMNHCPVPVWDPHSSSHADLDWTRTVLDSRFCKFGAISSAFETCSALCTIDGCLL